MRNTPSDLPLSPLDGQEIVARFDGGRLSSDGGLVLLREIDQRMGLSKTLADCLGDNRHPARIRHSYQDMIAARAMAIAAGYEDCDDLDALREDPALKIAIGRRPATGHGLPSQPTLSRFENKCAHETSGWRALARMGFKMIDLYCASYGVAPKAMTLDIDDTPDPVHGDQQLSLFNTHAGGFCFKPIHVYDSAGKPVACILFPGKRPKGEVIAQIIRHLVQRMRRHWPQCQLTIRGDGHYASHQAMDWLEEQGHRYVFGLASNAVLKKIAEPWVDKLAVERAFGGDAKLRHFASTAYQARSWSKPRHVVARLEATLRPDVRERAMDVRFIVTNIQGQSDQVLYEEIYCVRGQAENWIKEHKLYLSSDRTSCHKWQANQFRLFLHTAAYWLLYQVREKLAQTARLKKASFETLRRTLIKVAVRVSELKSRVKLSFPSSCPSQSDLRQLCQTMAASP